MKLKLYSALGTSGFLLAVAACALILAAKPRRRLTGKVVLLTGGSRGLGLQIARELANEGCRLILVARSQHELELAQQEIQRGGADVQLLVCDLAEESQVKTMLIAAQAIYGPIDIVINDAGRIDLGPVDAFTEEDFQAALNLMLWAPVRIVLGLLPTLLRSGDADIVNISSIGGKIAVPHLLPYSTAKFALCGFSEGLDSELRRRGVHVLTVTPGLLRTGSHKHALFAGNRADEYRWFALGATLPGVSMEVGRAARQIVSALKARKRALTLTWSAQVAMRLYGAFPNAGMSLMGMATWILPRAENNRVKQSGKELQNAQSSLIKAITSLGERAAASQHED